MYIVIGTVVSMIVSINTCLVNRHAKAGMIVRGTSIIDIGGVAGYGNACEEKGG